VFISGLTDWAGREGNFWGHNALLRVAAFAGAAGLPRLPGRAPFGGDILSHDFIEAAWLRRAGWGVAIAPDTRGSFEDGPQTLGAFHRRDRRWCQGNLQHLMLAFGARMHWVSRLHLISGIHSYLAAPIWLALVVLMAVAQPSAATFVPLVAVLALLMAPKLAGAIHWLGKGRRLRRKPWVLFRALGGELALSTLLAPLVLPLLAAPLLVAWLDAPRRAATSTRMAPAGLLGIGRARPTRRAA
jgi:membrane glycosyltransferase